MIRQFQHCIVLFAEIVCARTFGDIIDENAPTYRCERHKWSTAPSQYTNHVTQIVNWAIQYFANIDQTFNVSIPENYGHKITVVCDRNSSAKLFVNSDYSLHTNQIDTTYSRNGDTGYLAYEDGQLKILIVVKDGYEVDNISIVRTYKILKGPSETGMDNLYKITKIGSPLTSTIGTKKYSVGNFYNYLFFCFK